MHFRHRQMHRQTYILHLALKTAVASSFAKYHNRWFEICHISVINTRLGTEKAQSTLWWHLTNNFTNSSGISETGISLCHQPKMILNSFTFGAHLVVILSHLEYILAINNIFDVV